MIPPKLLRSRFAETTASYPVPFLAVTGCVAGLGVVSIASSQTDGTRFWAMFLLGYSCFGVVVAMVAFALRRQPDLLRSERTIVVGQAMEIYGDDQIGELAKARTERTVTTFLNAGDVGYKEPITRKKALPPFENQPERDDD